MLAPLLRLARNPPSLSVVRPVLLSIICAYAAVFSTVALAQAADEPADEVLRFDTDLLLFPIRIRNKREEKASPLTEQHLSLTDKDGVVSSLYFTQGVDRVAVVFALDQSGSIREIISQQREAALDLFSRFNERSSIAVLRFAGKPNLVAPFGKDTEVARKAFSFPPANNQPTAIFDAAAEAITSFEVLPRVRSERRIVILLSDGIDTASRTKANSVIDSAKAKRVAFYVIHIPLFTPMDDRLEVRPASDGFRQLAEKTGGKYFLVGNARNALEPQTRIDLTPVFKAIEDDLKSQFLLGFYISNAARDGRRHEFSLSLPDGYEYQVYHGKFSRKQPFFVLRPKTESR